MSNITSRSWTCRYVLHAGEGPAESESRIALPTMIDAAEAAESFAALRHDREMVNERMSEHDFDGCESHIEVKTADGWKRFVVACRVVRQYSASEIKTQEPTK